MPSYCNTSCVLLLLQHTMALTWLRCLVPLAAVLSCPAVSAHPSARAHAHVQAHADADVDADAHAQRVTAQCRWPENASGIECDMDLGRSQAGSPSATACAASCCARLDCASWQWSGTNCGASSGCGCWLGHKNVDGRPTGCHAASASICGFEYSYGVHGCVAVKSWSWYPKELQPYRAVHRMATSVTSRRCVDTESGRSLCFTRINIYNHTYTHQGLAVQR